MYLADFDKIARLRSTSTAYYRTKNPITDNYPRTAQKEKDALKFRKFQKKSWENCTFFSNVTGRQPIISDLTKTDSKKNVSCELDMYQEKVYTEVILLK